ncbi:MAG: hypothetical protein IJ737_02055 [Ruminococcus sp.]|nr:hypothetical protein [Ruminococcus sp.]
MNKTWYKIYEISVRALLAYAKPCSGGWYFFLDKTATERCLKLPVREQEENALFDQLMIMRGRPITSKDGTVIDSLAEDIFYADFSGIFDRNAGNPYYATLQSKAKSLFLPGNLMLDFGGGQKTYLAFERSQSMSRKGVLSFIRKDLYESIYIRITFGMKIGRCQLSKLYAYNGLMFSGGVRIDGLELDSRKVIVVDNPSYISPNTDVITVEERGFNGPYMKYERVERKQDIGVLGFDGEGLISPKLAKLICKQLGEDHTSFQIRLPYIKGMLHAVDFHDFFKSSDTDNITDIFGVKHKASDIGIILSKSMVKCTDWLKDCGMSWEDYWKSFDRYGHALYISGTIGNDISGRTELNYQFLNTLSLTADEFRPRDLTLTFPADDEREWLTKATEQEYYQLCMDDAYRRDFFLSKRPGKNSRERYLIDLLRKNPKLIAESYYTDMLKKKADKVLRNYALGRLTVSGYNRYLSGDLLEFMRRFLGRSGTLVRQRQVNFREATITVNFAADSFYALGADFGGEEGCTLLRNPHIARNEELQLRPYVKPENMRKYFLKQLDETVMINWDTLTAERLGGADFDGDMVKIITDETVNRCVRRNYDGEVTTANNIPLLKIPSTEPIISDANDWKARFETVRNTFSSRVGQISNAALNRSIIAYNENSTAEERERCRKETETLAILTGLEIDSVKTGVRPDLSGYLGIREIPRSVFLKYKALLEKSERPREFYEPAYKEQFDKFFENTDWDKVNSNLERLPWLAYNLRQNIKFREDDPAADSELFTFAVSPDWKDGLDKTILKTVSDLIKTYNKVFNRIHSCRQPVKSKAGQSDIRRILYMRGQSDDYDIDELYAAVSEISAERIEKIRTEIRAQKWHIAAPERREELVSLWLPELSEYYELFCDFRCCGFRILGDLIGDTDDANIRSEGRQFIRKNDTEQFRTLMTAYLEKPAHISYREAVAAKCRKLLDSIIKPDIAIRYVAALGKRRELLELYYDRLEKHIRRWRDA